MRIGEVAEQTGVSRGTIRFYERLGVVSATSRTASGYRVYTKQEVDEITFVKKAQHLGFSLDEVKETLRLTRTGTAPCQQVTAICRAHLAEVGRRIRDLEAFRAKLTAAVASGERGCGLTAEGFCALISDS